MNKSYKHNVKQKKPDEKDILYESIYIKYKNRQNTSIMLEVRIRGWVMTKKKPSGGGRAVFVLLHFKNFFNDLSQLL